jgi:glycosyltransferase involved in cell wall biosynthesis
MKVSVIVPTYNRAHMLTETIDSILAQTFQDFEIIVVDNESADDTEAVIKAYNDKRIRYFKNQNNGVVAVNRNYGITKAQGHYIAFCDDDDLWLPEKLEQQMREFEKDNQIGLVCTDVIVFGDDGEQRPKIKVRLKDSHFTFESLLRGNAIINSSVLVKKQVIDDIGMMDTSPEIFTAEDYELWLRIARKYRIQYIDLPLVKYRIHPGAHGSTMSSEVMQLSKTVYQKLLSKGIIDADLYQNIISRANRQMLYLKVPGYKWAIKHASLLKQSLHSIARDKGLPPKNP